MLLIKSRFLLQKKVLRRNTIELSLVYFWQLYNLSVNDSLNCKYVFIMHYKTNDYILLTNRMILDLKKLQ